MTDVSRHSEFMRWTGIFRLGLVQLALGSMTVLSISTLNRIMVIEYALPSMIPGALVALHYVVQMVRPRFGHGSDLSGRRLAWIRGGLLLLAAGTVGAAIGTASLEPHRSVGLVVCALSYAAIGLGVGAAGTSLLALLSQSVAASRRAAAATILWIMMIAGFAITAGIVGHYLDPYSPRRLVMITSYAVTVAVLIALTGLIRLGTGRLAASTDGSTVTDRSDFRTAIQRVWQDKQTQRFTAFIFLSMLAYSALELLLEPFAGRVFQLTPGASSRLVGALHSGAVLGMVVVAVATAALRLGSALAWVRMGCLASAAMLVVLAASSMGLTALPLSPIVSVLGFATGAFTVSSIGVMMELASARHDGRAGTRMGLWGGAQAIAFALGGMICTIAVDLLRAALDSSAMAYGIVFVLEATLFAVASTVVTTARHENSHSDALSHAAMSASTGSTLA